MLKCQTLTFLQLATRNHLSILFHNPAANASRTPNPAWIFEIHPAFPYTFVLDPHSCTGQLGRCFIMEQGVSVRYFNC